MNIGFYRWKDIDDGIKERLLRRSQANIDDVLEKVRPILENVRQNGDAALIQYAKQFDGAHLESLKVSEDEFEHAHKTLDDAIKKAIDHCAGNVRRFHEEQMRRMEERWLFEVEPGVWAGEQITPISSVGLYVPGGKNLFPSAVYMLSIPAVMAGAPKIIMVTPPQSDGRIGDALLYAAEVSGVKDIYKVGGAQAIAALAYGTDTVPAVKKVLGPGSPYVAAAKQLLSSFIDPGMPAGPSESIVLCDETADPHNTVLDILNEAEHGPDSAALLITHDQTIAEYAYTHLPKVINALPEPQRSYCETVMRDYGGVVLTDSLEDSIALANDYAVEHLLLKVKDPETVLPQIRNAGEILIGEYTPIVLGNYGIGVNHVLPTNGKAHTYSCTSVWDFLKRTSVPTLDKAGYESLKDPVETLTDYEGFTAHGNALRERNLTDSTVVKPDIKKLVA